MNSDCGENLNAGLMVLDSPEAVRPGYSSARFDGYTCCRYGAEPDFRLRGNLRLPICSPYCF